MHVFNVELFMFLSYGKVKQAGGQGGAAYCTSAQSHTPQLNYIKLKTAVAEIITAAASST